MPFALLNSSQFCCFKVPGKVAELCVHIYIHFSLTSLVHVSDTIYTNLDWCGCGAFILQLCDRHSSSNLIQIVELGFVSVLQSRIHTCLRDKLLYLFSKFIKPQNCSRWQETCWSLLVNHISSPWWTLSSISKPAFIGTHFRLTCHLQTCVSVKQRNHTQLPLPFPGSPETARCKGFVCQYCDASFSSNYGLQHQQSAFSLYPIQLSAVWEKVKLKGTL